jgi:hypothetical protein
VSTGRRSQQFHDLVEGTSTRGEGSPYVDLLEVVGALRSIPPPVPDPQFVTTLRERLLTEAATVLTPAAVEEAATDERLRLRPVAPRTRRRNRRLAVVLSGAVLVGGSATMAVAAQSALPGDGLYPLKRGLENAHAELTFDRADRGRVLLDSASTRLDEVDQLSRNGGSADQVGRTLDAFTDEAVQGSDLLVSDYQATGDTSSMTSVREFSAASMARLRDLQRVVPAGALDQLLQAARALDQVQQVSAHACPSCPGPSVTEVPPVLSQAAQAAAADTWLVAPGPHRGASSGGPGAPGGVELPDVGGDLPPASVTDPGRTSPDLVAPTVNDVRHTVQHLTDALTGDQQSDLGSTVTDSAGNLLDAVGDVGNLLVNTLGGTLDGVQGVLPTDLPTDLPTELPTLP